MIQDEEVVQNAGEVCRLSWSPVLSPLAFSFQCCLPDPDTNLKPYSLVRPVVVKAPRPVVLLPSCIAPRLIRNLLDLPTSRLDFHVCPAGRQKHVAAQSVSVKSCSFLGRLSYGLIGVLKSP